jgi:hypothetical protein
MNELSAPLAQLPTNKAPYFFIALPHLQSHKAWGSNATLRRILKQ